MNVFTFIFHTCNASLLNRNINIPKVLNGSIVYTYLSSVLFF